MSFGIPETSGHSSTKTIHNKAEGPTDPTNNKSDGPFVVCVTGAGKGLGFHISLAYAKAGVTGMIISSRTQSDLDTLSAELKKVNSKLDILAQLCDTQKDDEVKALAKETKDRFGRLDVCIANAGIISKYLSDGSLPKGIVDDLDFERVIDINLLGTVRVARQFTPILMESKGAQTFMVITSIAAHFTHSQLTPIAYNVSKQAACDLIEHMDNDHGKQGLISYAIHPVSKANGQNADMTHVETTLVCVKDILLHTRNVLEKGDIWEQALTDDIALCGGFLTWLTKERRPWLSGRYLAVTWDVDELEQMKDDIVKRDLLKFRMDV